MSVSPPKYRPPSHYPVAHYPPEHPNAYWRSMVWKPQPYVEPSVYPSRLIRPKDATLMSHHADPSHGSRSHEGVPHTYGDYDHLLHSSPREWDEEDEFAMEFGLDDDDDDWYGATAEEKAEKREKRKRTWQKFKAFFSKAAREMPPPPAAAALPVMVAPPPLPPVQQTAMVPVATKSNAPLIIGAVALVAVAGGAVWWATRRG